MNFFIFFTPDFYGFSWVSEWFMSADILVQRFLPAEFKPRKAFWGKLSHPERISSTRGEASLDHDTFMRGKLRFLTALLKNKLIFFIFDLGLTSNNARSSSLETGHLPHSTFPVLYPHRFVICRPRSSAPAILPPQFCIRLQSAG